MTGHYRFSNAVPVLAASRPATPRPAQGAEQTPRPVAEPLKVNTAAR
jgi:hypothetical protein